MSFKHKNKNLSWIIEKIIEYIDDEKHHYAIALEGEWGSGKTRFLENDVRPHLEKKKKKVIRISLFGITGPAELYERIADSLLHLSDTEKSKKRAVAKQLAKTASGIVSSFVSKMGFSFNINISPETIVNTLIKDTYIFIFDDTERRGTKQDRSAEIGLFGVINNLVENKGSKAIIVTNSLKTTEEDGLFDKDIKEKLIWRTYAFDPEPAELAKSIFRNIDCVIPEIRLIEIVSEASELAQCRNARAMIRAEIFIQHLFNSPVIANEKFSITSRISALRDCIRFALLCCMDKAPIKPEISEYPGEITQEWLERIHQESLFRQYSDLSIIQDYFNPHKSISQNNINNELEAYIQKRYPDSEGTLTIKKINEQLPSIGSMTDEEVSYLLNEYSEVIMHAAFSATVIVEVLSIHRLFVSLNFEIPFSNKDFVDNCKQIVEKEPEQTLIALSDIDVYHDIVGNGDERIIGDKLKEYAKQILSEQICIPSDEELLSKQLVEIRAKNKLQLVQIKPEIIAKRFSESSPVEQNDILDFFFNLESFLAPKNEYVDSFCSWIEIIKKEVMAQSPASKMDAYRKREFIRCLEGLHRYILGSNFII